MFVRLIRALACAALAAACVAGGAPPAHAQTAPDYVWVQFEADGLPHVRAIVHAPTCPSLTVGATTTPLALRAPNGPGFDDLVCDLVLPPNASGARVGNVVLPAIPRAPKTIAVFGDTGCRLKGAEVQACNDPVAWPFPTIAKDVAAAKPDLVIHVGDYYYRESPCPPSGTDCTNSPHGDSAASWIADWFAPMAPVFAVAPVVNVRGNHEDCLRSPLGWARYLSTTAVVSCYDHEPVYFVRFDNLALGIVDDATEVTETLPAPPVFLVDEAIVDEDAAQNGRETWLLVHRPPVTYEALHRAGDPVGTHIGLDLSGHIHTFGAYSFAGQAPQLITGFGGDNLAEASELAGLAVLGGVTDRRFGYALFTRHGSHWDIVVHDTTTAVHRRCRLEARTLTCGAALT